MKVVFYEVDFDNGYSMCIKADPAVTPTNEGLSKFLAEDLKLMDATSVVGFNPIDEVDARKFYDFDNEANWPVYDGK